MSRVKPQMDNFLMGFHEMVPRNLIKAFDERELEYLMCGIGIIDVKDWKENTLYKGGYYPNHIVIQSFWRVRVFDFFAQRQCFIRFPRLYLGSTTK